MSRSSSQLLSTFTLLFLSAGALGACGAPPEADDAPDVDGGQPDASPDASVPRLTTLWPDAPSERMGFGRGLAADGDTLVVGASEAPLRRGAVYVFVKRDGAWKQQAKLTGDDRAFAFGEDVAIGGDTIVVSERFSGATFDAPTPRRAHVFTRQGEVWTDVQTLAPPEPSPGYARSFAVQGDTIVIGDNGRYVGNERVDEAVRVYVKDGAAWTQRAALLPPAPAQPSFDYARAVAIDGDRIIASDPYATIGDRVYGKVYVFAKSADGAWAHANDFNPAFQGIWPHAIGFGASLALRGDRIVVGIAGDACPYVSVYESRSGQWSDVAKLDPNHNSCRGLGVAVAMRGDRIAIGAIGADNDEAIFRVDGAGYLFEKSTAGWPAMPESASPMSAVTAGSSIALTADQMLIGAPQSGTVYVYGR